jgi:hypothetical protein
MKRFLLCLALLLSCTVALAQYTTGLDPLKELRYCGPPKRDPVTGVILRDYRVIYWYRKVHKCPSTGLYSGACANWALNHVVPLACGGCDAVWNLTWMRNDVKKMVDAYEREIFMLDPAVPDTSACQFQLQTQQ